MISPRVLSGQLGCAAASFAQEPVDQELEAASEDFMRDESGVNDITAPSIKQILKDFSSFNPVPLDIIAENPRDAVYDNRLQTSLHIGALVADGFMLTIAERLRTFKTSGVRSSGSRGRSGWETGLPNAARASSTATRETGRECGRTYSRPS